MSATELHSRASSADLTEFIDRSGQNILPLVRPVLL